MENRAAVFTSQPQDVEIYRDGVWWPGALLGWRHDMQGSCQVWVRLTAGGPEITTWTDLQALRLPSTSPSTAPTAEAANATPPVEDAGPSAPAPSAPAWTARAPGADAIGAPAMGAPAMGAPALGAPASADAMATRELSRVGNGAPNRRPRPPVGTDGEPVHPLAAEELPSWRAAARSAQPAGPGRHRARAASGRHRAPDTDVFPAVPSEEPGGSGAGSWPVEVQGGFPVVVEDPWATGGAVSARPESPAEPLTRPLRLRAVPAGPRSRRASHWDAGLGVG